MVHIQQSFKLSKCLLRNRYRYFYHHIDCSFERKSRWGRKLKLQCRHHTRASCHKALVLLIHGGSKYLLGRFEASDECLSCSNNRRDTLEMQMISKDSRIRHHSGLPLKNQSGSRIQEGTIHTYPLRRSRFNLGKYRLDMVAVEPSCQYRSDR